MKTLSNLDITQVSGGEMSFNNIVAVAQKGFIVGAMIAGGSTLTGAALPAILTVHVTPLCGAFVFGAAEAGYEVVTSIRNYYNS